MSCSCYPNPCTCGCSSVEVSCADAGLETIGRHLAIYDSQFCSRRLANATSVGGFLWGNQNGVQISNEPRVLLNELEVEEDQEFDGFVINTGSNGYFRKVIPASGVDGVLIASSGKLKFQDPSSSGFTVPDPLTLTQLNVSILNATTPTISGTPTFSGLNSGTVTQTIGLNASNQLVKGTVATISVAQFYESGSFASGATPNFTFPATASSPVKVNNEISDLDGLAHSVSDTDIQIDKAGWYKIEWAAQFSATNPDGGNSAGGSYYPALWLYINSILRDRGNVEGYQDRNVGCLTVGCLNMLLAVGDTLQLRGNGSMRSAAGSGRGTGLQGVKLTLTKYR